ncbi:LytTR family DNA-binding domain-containing protein [Ferrimonas balearica]|uniref:LytTR family DNA-binding domain-containing protein n=1 Tax=Ferrimonas balearica TaxID=44012 RepID=UPI001C99940D|nr:LytTR family DNA-binding domain-containing protein [Ferrimonas balearica]MBY5991288.1 LytTR family transcriptional regulator DNA-binding domain-containing protein [Ferrimonas balearica]
MTEHAKETEGMPLAGVGSAPWCWPPQSQSAPPFDLVLIALPQLRGPLTGFWPCHPLAFPKRDDDHPSRDLSRSLILAPGSARAKWQSTLARWQAQGRFAPEQLLWLPEAMESEPAPRVWAWLAQQVARRFEQQMAELTAQLIRTAEPRDQARLCCDFVSRWLDVARIEVCIQAAESRKAPSATPSDGALELCWQTVPQCVLRVHLAQSLPQQGWIQARFESVKSVLVACRQSYPNLQQASYLGRLREQLDQILYINGANQYSEVIWGHQEKTELLYIPLKMVHRYLHPDLVQVHRSYLVNPNRVHGVRRKRNGRVELLLHLIRIPVGDTYRAELEAQFPHWFAPPQGTKKAR